MCSIISESSVLVIHLYLKIYFPIDHHFKIQSELSDPLEKGRITCTSSTVIKDAVTAVPTRERWVLAALTHNYLFLTQGQLDLPYIVNDS